MKYLIHLFTICCFSQEIATPRTEHLEIPDQPPAPMENRVIQTSLPSHPVVKGFSSIQVNINSEGMNIVGDAANETSIAVDPTNPNRIAIGWRQFDSISSNFRQAGWAFSSDGGQSWTFPGVINPGLFRSDPVLSFDAEGNFYYNSLTGDFSCTVFKSTSGGESWDSGIAAFGGDKQWMTIDRSNGIGHGNIYSAWNLSFSTCSGDFTYLWDPNYQFMECLNMPGSPIWGTMDVGPDGEVYVAGDGVLVKSSSLKDATLPPAFDFSQGIDLGGFTDASTGPNPGGLLGQVYVAVDASETAQQGWVYMLGSVNPPGVDPLDVMFIRSEDGGQSWSAPIRINQDATNTNAWQWFGMMDVAPDGRIDVLWNDTRSDPGGHDSVLYYTFSTDHGLSWSDEQAISPAFDPHLGYPQQQKMGDYYDMVSTDLGVHVAYSATFNGEQDAYYLWIPFAPPGPCPGDLNDDRVIDQSDLDQAKTNWPGETTTGDTNQNGVIDIIDILMIMTSFGPCN